MCRALAVFVLLICSCTQAYAETSLTRFLQYKNMYLEVQAQYWDNMPMNHIPCGQVEQESWWKPRAELKTPREYGFGFGQITITDRFNNFETAKKLQPLKDWVWEDRYNPRYQLTYLVLTNRTNFNSVKKYFVDDNNRWAATLVTYNAGLGTVLQRRRQAIKIGVRHDLWFKGLDQAFLPYEDRLLYGRKLGLMRNSYPELVFKKAVKYKSYLLK